MRSVFDVMNLTLKENVPGLLIFIDFQKAFDSLEWNFLLSCLEAFNFGPDFIRWVKTFYKNIQSCVINNGLMSDYFTLEVAQLTTYLLKRGYNRNFVTKQIRRASDIPRRLTLQTKDVNKPFITTFNPSLPHISNIIKKTLQFVALFQPLQKSFSTFTCSSLQTLPQPP